MGPAKDILSSETFWCLRQTKTAREEELRWILPFKGMNGKNRFSLLSSTVSQSYLWKTHSRVPPLLSSKQKTSSSERSGRSLYHPTSEQIWHLGDHCCSVWRAAIRNRPEQTNETPPECVKLWRIDEGLLDQPSPSTPAALQGPGDAQIWACITAWCKADGAQWWVWLPGHSCWRVIFLKRFFFL